MRKIKNKSEQLHSPQRFYLSISNKHLPSHANPRATTPSSRNCREILVLDRYPPPDLRLIDNDLCTTRALHFRRDGRARHLLESGPILGRLEALAHRLDHLAEPEEVQRIEDNVAAEVGEGQPE